MPYNYPNRNPTNTKVSKVPGKSEGLRITLKVMARDTIEISAKAFYNMDNSFAGKSIDVAPIVGSILAGMTNPVSTTLGESAQFANGLENVAGNSARLANLPKKEPRVTEVQPKSGINFVLYDESFCVVEENTGYLPVEDHINAIQTLATDKLVMKQSGYLEIFVNNDAQTPVYYDNMTVTRSGGNVTEVNAYYPYGMIIPNLSIPALYPEDYNGYKYNAKELQTELNLNWLDYGARMYDPFVFRFWAPDRFAEKYYHLSPYSYAANNPINFIDMHGDSIYHFNIATNQLTMVSDIGGNEQQIVYFVDENGKLIKGKNSAVIDGGSVFVTEASDGYLVSSYDPIENLSVDYNLNSGYEYTTSDLITRHKLQGTKSGSIVAGWEASGNAQPLSLVSHYNDYVQRWGTDKAFWFGLEGGFFGNVIPGAPDALNSVQGGLSKAVKATTSFNPNFSNVKSPIKNPWNRFAHSYKGSGKSMQEIRKEYYRQMKGIKN